MYGGGCGNAHMALLGQGHLSMGVFYFPKLIAMDSTKNESLRSILCLDENEDPTQVLDGLKAIYAFLTDYGLFPFGQRTSPLDSTELNGLYSLRMIIKALSD